MYVTRFVTGPFLTKCMDPCSIPLPKRKKKLSHERCSICVMALSWYFHPFGRRGLSSTFVRALVTSRPPYLPIISNFFVNLSFFTHFPPVNNSKGGKKNPHWQEKLEIILMRVHMVMNGSKYWWAVKISVVELPRCSGWPHPQRWWQGNSWPLHFQPRGTKDLPSRNTANTCTHEQAANILHKFSFM